MIDVIKLSNFLNKKNLNIDEFWFLYNIMIQHINIKGNNMLLLPINNDENISELNQQFQLYLEKYNNVILNNKISSRYELLINLEKKGFVEIWNDKGDNKINITDIKVTENFSGEFLVTDIDEAWKEVLNIYPSKVYVNGKTYPSFDKPMNVLKNIFFDKICKGLSRYEFKRFIVLTESYLEDNTGRLPNGDITAPCKLSKYFDEFEGIAHMMEDKEKNNNTNTGRKAK